MWERYVRWQTCMWDVRHVDVNKCMWADVGNVCVLSGCKKCMWPYVCERRSSRVSAGERYFAVFRDWWFEKRPVREPYMCKGRPIAKPCVCEQRPHIVSAGIRYAETLFAKKPMREPYTCENRPIAKPCVCEWRPNIVSAGERYSETLFEKRLMGEPCICKDRPTTKPVYAKRDLI